MSFFNKKIIISSLVFFTVNSFAVDAEEPMARGEADIMEIVPLKGNINFKGRITDSSCDADTEKDIDVYMGEHSVAKLKKAGDKTKDKTDFSILVTDCSLAMTSLKIKMEGQTHKDNPSLFALDAGEGNAGNVGIRIENKAGEQITMADGYRDIALTEGRRDYALEYKAMYQATGRATPGNANATVRYTISYE